MIKTVMKLFMSKKRLFEMMTYKVHSSKDISKVVENVEAACERYKFALLHDYVYHEVVKSKGFPIEREVYIYEVCQAKVAALVLTDEPSFAPFMPCRVAVYEEAGQVTISTQNMEMMLNALKDNEELYKQTSELFGTLKSLMNDIK